MTDNTFIDTYSNIMDPIFFTVKDLMIIVGYNYYNSAQRQHKAIRKKLGKENCHITIKEYCEYEKLDFDYIWGFLRGTKHNKDETNAKS